MTKRAVRKGKNFEHASPVEVWPQPGRKVDRRLLDECYIVSVAPVKRPRHDDKGRKQEEEEA